ncbi:glycosyltransferase family 4 protein [Oceanihabitans sp. 2_MG-2023]|uniref:glycosyltransferase family 4 protein n=1 Tax=Oceanihabitans sp. 2_MG-2023 TaxID=3062661 RepID=UPI0026E23B65|nr:glycosyltransferase family 4 protein [Oceanihabitans sp. 2_MG-2023]MDO6597676.1 glycosyltransferase family 4 protein [Oceanihabitans sp. 2_MG-2023]
MNKIKTFQLFETYGEQYQPYIPPVIEALKQNKMLDVSVVAFNKSSTTADIIIPSYRERRFKEKLYALTNRSKLNYLEIISLKQKVDIIHIQQSYMFSKVYNILQLPKENRPKIVITLRGGDTYVKPWYIKKWQDFYTHYGKLIDAFVVMSIHQKEYLHTKWKIPLNNIHVIPISFGEAFPVSEKKTETTILKVVSAYRMCWEKNIEGNLRVVKLLKEQQIPVQYEIYGGGADTGQVYYLIDKYNLSDCVTYFGSVRNKELKKRLIANDFYLQLSHSESLGMSVIEAQAQGLPAVVSNSDGLPEVVLDAKTGFCVSPNDIASAASHLIYLWKHPKIYKEFSKEAILYSHKNFNINKEVKSLKGLYCSLL